MKEKTIKKLEKETKEAGGIGVAGEFVDYRDTWRIFRVMAELVEGYNFLSTLKNEVTIFGSARLTAKNKYYKIALEIGSLLAKGDFTTITGGGPGIMEAANKGAFEAKGESIGLNIQLPFEQRINPYVKKSIAFYYFFTRKVMLASPANAFLFFPGGFGTMDEFFEVVDLMDQGILSEAPIIMVGKEYWQPLLDFLKENCCKIGSVTEEKMKKWHLVETAQEAYKYIENVEDMLDSCDISSSNFHCKGNIDWKIFRVMAELVEGFDFITGLKRPVTILGTRSLKKDSPFYEAAYLLGKSLADKKYSVVTGGKFGTAEAANKGAFEAGGASLGIGMRIGNKEELNHYLSRSILFHFPFTRKLIVTAPTKALVFFPGGLGSMHYLFEVLTLMQTKKMPRIPVILYNNSFWNPLNEYIKKVFIHDMKTINEEDGKLFQIVDSVEEIMAAIEE